MLFPPQQVCLAVPVSSEALLLALAAMRPERRSFVVRVPQILTSAQDYCFREVPTSTLDVIIVCK